MLNKRQIRLLDNIHAAIKSSNSAEIVYTSEWLGHLPYGFYHWLKVGNQEIPLNTDDADFLAGDLNHLVRNGYLIKLKEIHEKDDSHRVYFKKTKSQDT